MRSNSSAQIELVEPTPQQADSNASRFEHSSSSLLRQQVAERLAAHRSRRKSLAQPALFPDGDPANHHANPIAKAVAERYAHSQSYRDFLAAEAQRAIDQAHAVAEVAARNAEAVTAVQQQLLDDLEHWSDPTGPMLVPPPLPEPEPQAVVAHPVMPAYAVTVRPFDDSPLNPYQAPAAPPVSTAAAASEPAMEALHEAENVELDEEIAFRQAPVFDEPTVLLPANLIEFPRQLVAARKARPRLAEGPLREEAEAAETAQLRIFEVETEAAPPALPVVKAIEPEWASIHLDPPVLDVVEAPDTVFALPPQPAPLSQRLMAATVDACVLGGAFLGVVTAFALAARQLPSGPVTAGAAVATFVILFVLYQMLFFTFADATPGMRYARIGLCTFSDDNPTRAAMRKRTFALLLAACPLGIGFLWALLDDDRLGWHDRISRMYQRGY